jgi:hypothetical protein
MLYFFTTALQVYGGAVSMIIGSYSWSFVGVGSSSVQSGDTLCIQCSISMSGITIRNSHATTSTYGKCRSCSCSFSALTVLFLFMNLFTQMAHLYEHFLGSNLVSCFQSDTCVTELRRCRLFCRWGLSMELKLI